MSKEERFELSCCLFNESNMDFIRDKKTNEEYVVLDELVPTLNQQDAKIADLEAKLAESEEQLKEELEEKNGVRRALRACHHQNDEFADMIKKLVSEKEELKQQLAEKEKEIENLKEQFAIDYAIEQLEELRLSFICNYHDNISWIDDRENSCCLNLTTTIYNTTMDIFNNQITALTHQHEDKGEN